MQHIFFFKFYCHNLITTMTAQIKNDNKQYIVFYLTVNYYNYLVTLKNKNTF